MLRNGDLCIFRIPEALNIGFQKWCPHVFLLFHAFLLLFVAFLLLFAAFVLLLEVSKFILICNLRLQSLI